MKKITYALLLLTFVFGACGNDKTKISTTEKNDDGTITKTEVDVKVNLGQSEISLKELMSLKVGDVIPLDQDANGEFDILVQEVKKYKGLYGVYHGSVAMQITKPIIKERNNG